MAIEIVYLGRDNKIDLQLLSDGEVENLANITKMILDFGKDLLGSDIAVDSDTSPAAFDWSEGNGILHLTLGQQSISAGLYWAKLIVIDSSNPNGVVWGEISMRFI